MEFFKKIKYTLFYISNTFISNARLQFAKIQTNGNTLRLNFCYLKIIHILHPRYHPKIIGYTVKNKQNNKLVCIHEIVRFNNNGNEDQREK